MKNDSRMWKANLLQRKETKMKNLLPTIQEKYERETANDKVYTVLEDGNIP